MRIAYFCGCSVCQREEGQSFISKHQNRCLVPQRRRTWTKRRSTSKLLLRFQIEKPPRGESVELAWPTGGLLCDKGKLAVTPLPIPGGAPKKDMADLAKMGIAFSSEVPNDWIEKMKKMVSKILSFKAGRDACEHLKIKTALTGGILLEVGHADPGSTSLIGFVPAFYSKQALHELDEKPVYGYLKIVSAWMANPSPVVQAVGQEGCELYIEPARVLYHEIAHALHYYYGDYVCHYARDFDVLEYVAIGPPLKDGSFCHLNNNKLVDAVEKSLRYLREEHNVVVYENQWPARRYLSSPGVPEDTNGWFELPVDRSRLKRNTESSSLKEILRTRCVGERLINLWNWCKTSCASNCPRNCAEYMEWIVGAYGSDKWIEFTPDYGLSSACDALFGFWNHLLVAHHHVDSLFDTVYLAMKKLEALPHNLDKFPALLRMISWIEDSLAEAETISKLTVPKGTKEPLD